MERKLIALVLIALLAGLGGGYVIGFIMYEPKLSKLQSDVSTLKTNCSDLSGDLSELETNYDSLNVAHTQLKTDYESLKTDVDELNRSKTWHFVSEFTLSRDNEDVSPIFLIQGEKWRITWQFGEFWGLGTGWCGFIIYNEDGYVIDSLDEVDLLIGYTLVGIYYAFTETGKYYIELRNIAADGIDFTVEEYY